jgi:hypothetical protein
MTTPLRILTGAMLTAIAGLSLGACSYHERTVVERPVATEPASTVVVPDDRQPTTVVVPDKKPDVVVVPNND